MEMELSSGEAVRDPSPEAVHDAIRALARWDESVVLRDEALGMLMLCGPEGQEHHARCEYRAGERKVTGECPGLRLEQLFDLADTFLSRRTSWRDRMGAQPAPPPRDMVAWKAALAALALFAIGFVLARAF